MELKLPTSIVDRRGVLDLLKELELYDEAVRSAQVRATSVPQPTELSKSVAELNKLDLTKTTDRATLQHELDSLLHDAPTVHISFASDPPREVLAKLSDWLRQESGRPVLLSVGLQPTLAGGCTIKTATKLFDFSFRQRLHESQKLLAELIIQP